MEIEPLNFQFHWRGSRLRWNLPLLSKFCHARLRRFLQNLAFMQAAREAARRIQCMNNMRQLAFGLANYELAFKRLAGYGGEVSGKAPG